MEVIICHRKPALPKLLKTALSRAQSATAHRKELGELTNIVGTDFEIVVILKLTEHNEVEILIPVHQS